MSTATDNPIHNTRGTLPATEDVASDGIDHEAPRSCALPKVELLADGALRTWTTASYSLVNPAVDDEAAAVRLFRCDAGDAIARLSWRRFDDAHPYRPGLAIARIADLLAIAADAVAYGQHLSNGLEVLGIRASGPDGLVEIYAVQADSATTVLAWDNRPAEVHGPRDVLVRTDGPWR